MRKAPPPCKTEGRCKIYLKDLELDQKSAAIGISRNELINHCVRFALNHMEENIDARPPQK